MTFAADRNVPTRQVVGLETMSAALPLAMEYHRWLWELMQEFVGHHVLDVGAGAGSYLPFLKGRRVTCLDVSTDCVQRLRERFRDAEFEYLVSDVADPSFPSKLVGWGVDTVICLNVLEHIREDAVALRNLHDILLPTGGHLVLIVPAHQFLYGEMDRLAGHFRRYSRTQFTALLEESGFSVIKASYFNMLGAVGWWVNGRLFRPRTLSTPAINRQILFFSRIVVPIIKRVERVVSPCFGQSLLVVGRARP